MGQPLYEIVPSPGLKNRLRLKDTSSFFRYHCSTLVSSRRDRFILPQKFIISASAVASDSSKTRWTSPTCGSSRRSWSGKRAWREKSSRWKSCKTSSSWLTLGQIIQGEMVDLQKVQLSKNINHSLLVILCLGRLLGKLILGQVDSWASWLGQVDFWASWLLGKLTFGQVDLGKLTFWQVDSRASWLLGKLTFWQVDVLEVDHFY
jgi:hypothetical protein